MKYNFLKELNKIFVSYFNDKKIKLDEKTTSNKIKAWDSLAQVSLIILIEKKFKVKFSVKEVNNLKNIGDMVKLLEKKMK